MSYMQFEQQKNYWTYEKVMVTLMVIIGLINLGLFIYNHMFA